LFGGENRAEVLWIDTGVVAISPFGIDVKTAGKGIGFGAKLSRTETDNKVEGGEKLRPSGLASGEEFGSGEVFQIFVICYNVNGMGATFEVVSPIAEGFVDS
jgi:hypothetical protein